MVIKSTYCESIVWKKSVNLNRSQPHNWDSSQVKQLDPISSKYLLLYQKSTRNFDLEIPHQFGTTLVSLISSPRFFSTFYSLLNPRFFTFANFPLTYNYFFSQSFWSDKKIQRMKYLSTFENLSKFLVGSHKSTLVIDFS